MVKISTVTVTYNRPDMIKKCVENLEEQSLDREEYEIIVVNQGSEEIEVEPDKLVQAEDKGVAYGRNKGIEVAEGEIIAFLDDDCLADETWLENGQKVIREKNLDGLEGVIEDDSGRLDEWGESRIWGFVTANIFYTKEMLEKVGGFDERYTHPIFREDTDLAWSILEKGGEIGYSEIVKVHHLGAESTKNWKKHINDVLLQKKHPERFREMVYDYSVLEMHKVAVGWILGCKKYNRGPYILSYLHLPYLRKFRDFLEVMKSPLS